MLRKIILVVIVAILVIVGYNSLLNSSVTSLSYFKNKAYLIYGDAAGISDPANQGFKDYHSWLWHDGRKFSFDIIYMNLFSPGTATISIKEEKQTSSFIIEAQVELNNFFKKLYDAKMIVNSTVNKDNKVSLRYKEFSHTPEEDKSKEIIFDPVAKVAEREGVKFKIPDSVYDPLAAFLKLLDSEFRVGETIVLDSLSKEEIYEFKATPVEFENGIYKLNGEVFRKDRSSKHGASFTMWVKDGEVRMPLLIKVISAAGPIYVRLKEAK